MSKPFKIDRKTGRKQFLRICQWKGIRWSLRKRFSALFMDMGLGKTVVVLSVIVALKKIYRELIGEDCMKPVLVVGPIRVIYGVWAQEAAEWSHTKHLSFSVVHGTERQRLKALEEKSDVYLTNHENLRWLLRRYSGQYVRRTFDENGNIVKKLRHTKKLDMRGSAWPFSILVIDESSAYKAPGSKRFTKLRYLVKFFMRRIILTGTPRPNSLRELWPQLYIVDEGKRLGASFNNFMLRFFAPDNPHKDHPELVPREHAEDTIHELVRDVALSMEAKDWLEFPPTIPNDVFIDLPPSAREKYDRFEKEMFLELERGDVDAITAGALSMRCWQMANGSIYTRERATGERIWEETHKRKLEALEEIIEETGSPVLVAYWFKPDLERIRRIYPEAPAFGRQRDNRLENEWNAGKHRVVLCHYKSAAHGMNLQHGPGHTIALFSLTWSYELYDQLINRIGGARAQRPVTVHHIRARNTTDDAQMLSLGSKMKGNRATLTALNAYRNRRANERRNFSSADFSHLL